MTHADLTKMARQLLDRRIAPNSPWYYFSRQWRRQVLFLVAYVVVPIALWHLNLTVLAIAMACFIAGAKIRDVRWWIALSKQWPTTSKLLDWNKIQEIANDDIL